ncbi:MAG: serine/threonine-protein kinase [Kofleriaceae bacterium]
MIGEVVGSYRITQKLSVGGMGTVYRAEHLLIGRDAALKVLHPELSSNRDIVQRFFNEAKATTTIKHPGIVEVFDFGYMESGHAYLVMEFLDGVSLARRLKVATERMAEGEAALLMRGVCNALAAAHAKGIVHRDLKPDNLMLVPDAEAPTGERPKILDFGIAKLTDIGLAGTATKTGAVMGTPTYMSPEQCRGTGKVDARADLYSIGCIYYELLCGRPPFNELGAGELIGAHLFVEPTRPSQFQPGISPDSVALIMALLQKQPEQRPQSATELARLFAGIAQRHGWVSATRPNVGGNLADQPTVIGGQAVSFTPPPPTPYAITPPQPVHFASEPSGEQVPSAYTPPVQFTPPPGLPPKPTTLSGAASQSVINLPRRSRRPLVIGIVAVAVSAIAITIIVGVTGAKDRPIERAAAPVGDPVSAPVITQDAAAAPIADPVPPPPQVIPDAMREEPVATKVEPKPDPKTQQKPPKKPPKPPKKPPTEQKPTLIETDI